MYRFLSSIPVWWLAIVLLISALEPAPAQMIPGTVGAPAVEEEPVAPPPSPNDVRELMRLLSDQSMIEWLRTQSENPEGVDKRAPSASLTEEFANRVEQTRMRIGELVVSWQNLPFAPQFLIDAWQSEVSSDDTLRSLTYVLIFLAMAAGLNGSIASIRK